jgi:hypothetical protein
MQAVDEANNRRTVRQERQLCERPLRKQQHSHDRCGRVLIERMMVVDFGTTASYCAPVELSPAESSPRQMQNRGRSLHVV